ncbi:MAG: HEAT repeat domain-containing protein [Gammaproteobacteria bacterium]|nr:HEAT repeat domain-containing protein [Gammaproteobacteria bacterium]MBI5616102.1 HEAT repeat domain-containing protein [Gammaproteobacteria bacterium]
MTKPSSWFARLAAGVTLALTLNAPAPAGEAAPAPSKILLDAVKVARELSGSRNVYDRMLGAGALVEAGDPKALEIIAAYIKSDDIVVRRSAIDTLLNVNHPSSTNLLYRIASEDPQVLDLMIESLATLPREDMSDLLVGALRVPNLRLQKNALQALAPIMTGSQEKDLRELIKDPQSANLVRAYAYYVLVRFSHGTADIEQVLQIAKSDDLDQREVAAVTLGAIDSAASKTALAVLAKEQEERVSIAAVASNAGLGDDKAIAQMIQLIAYGKPMQATVAAGALKRMPANLAGQITATLLKCCQLKPDAATRLIESWGSITANPDSIFKWGLANADADIRLQTLQVIGRRRDKNVLEQVAGFLADEDPAIRGMAAWAIIHTVGDGTVAGVET